MSLSRELQEGVECALSGNPSNNPRLEAARDRLSEVFTDLVHAEPLDEAIVKMGGDVYADTAFLNASRGLLPGFTLKHMGFGEFYLEGPGGAEIQFDRMRGKPFPGQSGRSHKLYDNQGGKLVQQLLAAAQDAGIAEGIHEVVMSAPQGPSEAETVPGDPKAAKAATSFPAGLDRRKAAALSEPKAKGKPGVERKKRGIPSGAAPKGGTPTRKGMSTSKKDAGTAVGKRRSRELGFDKGPASGKKPAAGRGGGTRNELPGTKGSGKAVGEARLNESRSLYSITGTRANGAQIPSFLLDADALGIVSRAHAWKIAMKIVGPGATLDAYPV